MFFIPNPEISQEEIEIDLSVLVDSPEPLNIQINKPIGYDHIVIDQENTVLAYQCVPLYNSGYYHPQPTTDFIVLGQLFKDEQTPLPLNKKSYLFDCTIN